MARTQIPPLPATSGSCGCCPKWITDCCPYDGCGVSGLLAVVNGRHHFLDAGDWSGFIFLEQRDKSRTVGLQVAYLTITCDDGEWNANLLLPTEGCLGFGVSAYSSRCQSDPGGFELKFNIPEYPSIGDFGELGEIEIVVSEALMRECACCCLEGPASLVIQSPDFGNTGNCMDCDRINEWHAGDIGLAPIITPGCAGPRTCLWETCESVTIFTGVDDPPEIDPNCPQDLNSRWYLYFGPGSKAGTCKGTIEFIGTRQDLDIPVEFIKFGQWEADNLTCGAFGAGDSQTFELTSSNGICSLPFELVVVGSDTTCSDLP